MTGEIQRVMTKIDRLMIVEEQSLSGSFAELLISKMALSRRNIPISMMHLPESYIFDNGTREQLLNTNGLSVSDIQLEIDKILKVV